MLPPVRIATSNAFLHVQAPEVDRARTIPADKPQPTPPHKTCSAGRLLPFSCPASQGSVIDTDLESTILVNDAIHWTFILLRPRFVHFLYPLRLISTKQLFTEGQAIAALVPWLAPSLSPQVSACLASDSTCPDNGKLRRNSGCAELPRSNLQSPYQGVLART